MSRRVDDVESMLLKRAVHALPKRRRRRRRYGDAALLLLLHPVHRRGTIMDFANLVTHTGIEQDALGRRGLAGINVSHDAEVTITLDGSGACHGMDLVNFLLPKGKPNASRPPTTSHLPAVVRKRLVGLSHTMGFFTLLGGTATAFRGFQQLSCQLARH
jgi:hypothetical protein